MTIQERPCPGCGVPRTLRLWGGQSLCANCRRQWLVRSRQSRTHTVAEFTPNEVTRLTHYRDAVAHGLYSEWPCQTS
jgi:hypothetical protein